METLLKKSCEVVRRAGNALKGFPGDLCSSRMLLPAGLTVLGNMGMMPMTGWLAHSWLKRQAEKFRLLVAAANGSLIKLIDEELPIEWDIFTCRM